MKNLFLIFTLFCLSISGFAQSEKYEETMTRLTGKILANENNNSLQTVANELEQVLLTETSQWIPAYWIAYCYIHDTFLKKSAAAQDQMLDVADSYLKNAEEKAGPQNSEIEVMKALSVSGRLSVDPVGRWDEYGMELENLLNAAAVSNPLNPRVEYIRGMIMFHTPDNFGGGKKVAKPFFESALKKFDKFKPETAYHPNWGQAESQYFLSQCN
jgi:hypothetical protein